MVGCRQPAKDSASSCFFEWTDSYGRSVSLEKAPQRIVSLSPAITEILYIIGADDKLVAVSDFCHYPPEAAKLPKVGGMQNINKEALLAQHPDVLLIGSMVSEKDVEAIEKIVHPCGLGPSKARDISLCMRMLLETFGGRVPDTMEELLKLPGVGRKSANLVLGDVFGQPAIVTDTHCIRLSNRIGLVDQIREPAKVEKALRAIVPPEEGNALCHRFVEHGRAVCTARTSPRCETCCLQDICEKHIESTNRKNRCMNHTAQPDTKVDLYDRQAL